MCVGGESAGLAWSAEADVSTKANSRVDSNSVIVTLHHATPQWKALSKNRAKLQKATLKVSFATNTHGERAFNS